MRIGLHDSERGNGYPNLALMKLSAAHKADGDTVEWFSQFNDYDKVYSSKVFTFTPADPFIPKNSIKGGTGYCSAANLPDNVEAICPDYSLYFGCDRSYGFLTRGCPNKCEWCFVPGKEGDIRPAADIEDFLRHDKCVLMDNNVLASDHGIRQIEKIIRLGVKVDFNQGLDARLIDGPMARLLAKVKWLDPFAQAYRDKEGTQPTKEQLEFERWVNMRSVNKTTTWEEYGQSKKRKSADSTAQKVLLGFAR